MSTETEPATTSRNPELDAFRKKVAAVAWDYAQRHSWCHAVVEALGDMGIPVSKPELETVLEVKIRVKAGMDLDDLIAFSEDTHRYLQRSLSFIPRSHNLAVVDATVMSMSVVTAQLHPPVVLDAGD